MRIMLLPAPLLHLQVVKNGYDFAVHYNEIVQSKITACAPTQCDESNDAHTRQSTSKISQILFFSPPLICRHIGNYLGLYQCSFH